MEQQQKVGVTVHRSAERNIAAAMRKAFEDSLRRTSIAPKRGGYVLIETSEKGIITAPNVEVYKSMGAASFAMQEKALKAAFLAMAPIVQDLVLERLREPSDELVKACEAVEQIRHCEGDPTTDFPDIRGILTAAVNYIEDHPQQ